MFPLLSRISAAVLCLSLSPDDLSWYGSKSKLNSLSYLQTEKSCAFLITNEKPNNNLARTKCRPLVHGAVTQQSGDPKKKARKIIKWRGHCNFGDSGTECHGQCPGELNEVNDGILWTVRCSE